ncbi:MAG: 30S ribosomal protein S20 [Deltaproteobacteria bacterium]|nr:30S ribosomal protein S20 [Deltaproteobacteria bacterium]
MANHKSAIKRNTQSINRRMRNRAVKTRVKNVINAVATARKNGEDTTTMLLEAQSVIDKAAKKGTIHRRTASRKISRLVKRAAKPVAV